MSAAKPVRERAINFTAEEVRAILEGRKTQARRIVKPQPNVVKPDDALWFDGKADFWHTAEQYLRDRCPFGVAGDRLMVYCKHDTIKRRDSQGNSRISQPGLHGGIGRKNLLSDQIRGVGKQDEDRLVSAGWAPDQKGVSEHQPLPQEREGDQERPSPDLPVVSWDATISGVAGEASRWRPVQQPSGEPAMGNSVGELARSENPREAVHEPNLPIHAGGTGAHSMGNSEWIVLATAGRPHFGRFPVLDPRACHALTLEVTEVSVQRVQEISEADAEAEGIRELAGKCGVFDGGGPAMGPTAVHAFMRRWNSLHGSGAWERNEWAWAIAFRRMEKDEA